MSLQGAWCAFLLLCAACWVRHRFSRRMRPVPGDLLTAVRWGVVALTLTFPLFYATLVLAVLFCVREPRERLRLESLLLPVYLVAHGGEWAALAGALASAWGLRWLLGALAEPPRGWSAPFETRPRLRSCCRVVAGTLFFGLPLLSFAVEPWQYALTLFAFGVGGSPWSRRGARCLVEGTPEEGAAVVSLLGSLARARLRDHLCEAHRQMLLDAQPDYLTAAEQGAVRDRFLRLGPWLSCATVLDRCPVEDLTDWLQCFPEEIRRSFLAMLDDESREGVTRRLGVGVGVVSEDEQMRIRNRMLERYPDTPRVSLDEMVELWPRWFADALARRCLHGHRPAPARRALRLPTVPGKALAVGVGLVLGLTWPAPHPTAADALRAFGGRVVQGPRTAVAVVPAGVETDAVRCLVGGGPVFAVPPAAAAPLWPWLAAAAGLGLLWLGHRPPRPVAQVQGCVKKIERPSSPPSLETLLRADVVRFEVGRSLLGLVDPNASAPLLKVVTALRRKLATELGVVLPGMRFIDSLKLQPDEYRLLVRENEVIRGTVAMHHYLAVGGTVEFSGKPGLDPATGQQGVWIPAWQRAEALAAQATLSEPSEVVAVHLKRVLFSHAAEFITMQEADAMLKCTAKEHPAVVKFAREQLPLFDLAAFLRHFLRLHGSVRDLPFILELMCTQLAGGKDPQPLAERCVRLYKGVS